MNWIDAKKETPDENVNVLAVENGILKVMAYCYIPDDNNEMNWFWGEVRNGLDGDAYVDDDYDVTHWMPLPIPPTI